MNNWLIGLSSHQPTDEELLRDSVDALRGSELGWEIECALDPSLRTTHVEKMASKIETAVRQGRELAHESSDLEKIAFIPALVAGAARLAPLAGRAVGALGGAKGIIGGVAKDMAIGTAANKVMGALKPAAPAAAAAGEVAGGFKYAFAGGLLQRAAGYAVRNPGTALTAAGAIGGAIMAPRDAQTGQKQYLRGAVMGGVGAAGVNALSNGAIAGKMRASVMNRESPLLGQGTRKYLMDSASATKQHYPKPVVAPAATAAAASPAQPVATATAGRPQAPEWAAAHSGVAKMRERAGFDAMHAVGMDPMAGPIPAAAPQVPSGSAPAPYRSGPSMGAIKLAEQQFLAMSPAQQILFMAALEKKAYVGPDQVVGGLIGYSKGRQQAERGEKHTFGGKQLASVLIPGGLGYQVGRAIGHNGSHHEKKANQQTLTYDPATKTFTRQHLTPSPGSEAVQGTGAAPIPAGHAEMVRNSGTGMAPYGSKEYLQARMQGAGIGQARPSAVTPATAPAALSQSSMPNRGAKWEMNEGMGMGRPIINKKPAVLPGSAGGVAGIGAAAAKPRALPTMAGLTLARK